MRRYSLLLLNVVVALTLAAVASASSAAPTETPPAGCDIEHPDCVVEDDEGFEEFDDARGEDRPLTVPAMSGPGPRVSA